MAPWPTWGIAKGTILGVFIHPRSQAHAQLARDGQGLVQHGGGLFSVAGLVALEQGVSVVAAGPGQLGPVASLPAEGPNWFAQLGLRKGGLRSSRDQAEPSG